MAYKVLIEQQYNSWTLYDEETMTVVENTSFNSIFAMKHTCI